MCPEPACAWSPRSTRKASAVSSARTAPPLTTTRASLCSYEDPAQPKTFIKNPKVPSVTTFLARPGATATFPASPPASPATHPVPDFLGDCFFLGLPWWLGEESSCSAEAGWIRGLGKCPWRRGGTLTPAFLLGEFTHLPPSPHPIPSGASGHGQKVAQRWQNDPGEPCRPPPGPLEESAVDRDGSRCTPDLAAVGPTGLPSPSVSQLTQAVPRSLWTRHHFLTRL